MTWAAWFLALITPAVRRVLSALGIGFITYAGFAAVKSQIAAAVNSSWTGLAADVYQIAAMGGFIDAVGIWLGALTTIAALLAFKRLGVLAS